MELEHDYYVDWSVPEGGSSMDRLQRAPLPTFSQLVHSDADAAEVVQALLLSGVNEIRVRHVVLNALPTP